MFRFVRRCITLGFAVLLVVALTLLGSFQTATASGPPPLSKTKLQTAVLQQSGVGVVTTGPTAPVILPLPANTPTPLPVGVALFLTGIAKINDQAGTYEGNFDLRLRWRDPGLAFDAKANGTDRQEYGGDAAADKLATIWTPRITLANLVDKTAQGRPGLFIYADGSVVYVQRFRTTFESKFKLAAFPFDTQDLTVRLLSSKYSVNEVAFIQEQQDVNASGFKDGLKISGWTPKRLEFAASRSRGWNGEFVPEIEARILIKRVPDAHLIAVLTPFLLALLVPTMITLYANEPPAPRLASWAGAILGMVALSFTFSVRYPALDSDSLISQVIASGFGYATIMVLLTVTVFNPVVATRLANKYVIQELAGYFRWSLPVGFLAFLTTRTLLTALSW